MKKLTIIMLGLMMAVGTAFAQDCNKKDCTAKHDTTKVRINVEQKAQMLTDRMAKAYDLTEEQKAKLLELNTKTLKLRRHAMRGNQHGQHNAHGQKPMCQAKPECGDNSEKCQQQKAEPCKADTAQCKGPRKDQMQRRGNGYMHALKQILTPEQWKAYAMDKRLEMELTGFKPQMNQKGPRGNRWQQGRRQQRHGHGFGPQHQGQMGHHGPQAGPHKQECKEGKQCDMKDCNKDGQQCDMKDCNKDQKDAKACDMKDCKDNSKCPEQKKDGKKAKKGNKKQYR